jgi:hypothetical protein
MLITMVGGHKFFTLFNDNSVAHHTALKNWMTVKWLGSNFRSVLACS